MRAGVVTIVIAATSRLDEKASFLFSSAGAQSTADTFHDIGQKTKDHVLRQVALCDIVTRIAVTISVGNHTK